MTEDITAQIEQLLKAATPESAAQLRDLSDTAENKEHRKAARRALYLLSQRGVHTPERATPAVRPAPNAPPDRLRVYASAHDGAGNRLLLYISPDSAGRSADILQVLISDLEGVKDYGVRRMSRQELQSLLDQFEGQLGEGMAIAEIEPDYGRHLLQVARDINRAQIRATPAGFLAAVETIGPPRTSYQTAPVYTRLDAEELQNASDISQDPADLFALAWFEPWFLEVEETYPWFQRIAEAGQSQLRLPESVKARSRDKAFREAIAGLLPSPMRALYASRLEEAADILARRGEDTAARMALHHARSLRLDVPVEEVAFARHLVQRSLDVTEEMLRSAEDESKASEMAGGTEEPNSSSGSA